MASAERRCELPAWRGQFIIAVDEDIDPETWTRLVGDVLPIQTAQGLCVLPGKIKGHSPPFEDENRMATAKEVFYHEADDSALLINAILKEPFRRSRCPSENTWSARAKSGPTRVSNLAAGESLVRLFPRPMGRRVGGRSADGRTGSLLGNRRQTRQTAGQVLVMAKS